MITFAGDAVDLRHSGRPLLAPLEGAAPDLVTTTKTSGQTLVLVGRDGANVGVLWRRSVPGTSASRLAVVDAVRLYAIGCRSLLVTGYPRMVHAVVRVTGCRHGPSCRPPLRSSRVS